MHVDDVLGEDGLFANELDDFTYRHAQLDMARHVTDAIDDVDQLVVEAATGVGKTFAYAIPAMLAGGKTIISTGSRHLQDQLFLNDLPKLKNLLGITVHTALLKGRNNYLCNYRLTELEKRLPRMHGEIHEQYAIVKRWSQATKTGDISEVSELNEDAMIWQYVTSSAEHCSTKTCTPKTCFVVKARREAQEADIVVVNHHLFFADLALKEEGFGEILPSANTFILDEAHQLPETASRFFGRSLTSRRLLDLARDIVVTVSVDAPDAGELKDIANKLETCVRQFRLSLLSADVRKPWSEVVEKAKSKEAFVALATVLNDLVELGTLHAERSEALENIAKRAVSMQAIAKDFTEDDIQTIKWYETRSNGFLLHETPFEIASIFREHMSRYHASWVFTSATLSINGSFDHYIQQMGLEEPETALLNSPFDFDNNARIYLPHHLPLPNMPEHTLKLVDEVKPLIEILNGRTLFLFTSFRALHKAAEHLLADQAFAKNYTLLVQGDAPRTDLIQQFRQAKDKGAILLATSGFWEGVDIKGEALQLVVIDKLPFATPDDPVLQARFKAIEKQGFNAFSYYQIPKAVISLKQGAGRLIRGYEDKGILVLGDPRIKKKFYGRLFLNSLPAMPVVDKVDFAKTFLQQL